MYNVEIINKALKRLANLEVHFRGSIGSIEEPRQVLDPMRVNLCVPRVPLYIFSCDEQLKEWFCHSLHPFGCPLVSTQGFVGCDGPLKKWHCRSLCSSVYPSPFFSFVSLESVVHLEWHKASKSVEENQWESRGCFKGVFTGCLRLF